MADLTSDLKAALLATSEHFETTLRRVVRDELAAFRQHGDPDALLDAEAAAQLLGMSAAALRRATERGRFPIEPVRIARRLRWRRGDLLQLVPRDRSAKPSSTGPDKTSISGVRVKGITDPAHAHTNRGKSEPPASPKLGQRVLT